jgi:hypothetical protein
MAPVLWSGSSNAFELGLNPLLSICTSGVNRTENNALAISRNLHVFTGVRLNDPKNDRDWAVTKVWAYSMDAIAIGLLAMVATGVWIWLQSRSPRWPGLIALGAGVICCGWFVWGVVLLGN